MSRKSILSDTSISRTEARGYAREPQVNHQSSLARQQTSRGLTGYPSSLEDSRKSRLDSRLWSHSKAPSYYLRSLCCRGGQSLGYIDPPLFAFSSEAESEVYLGADNRPESGYSLPQHTSASAEPPVWTQFRELGQHHVAPHGGASAGQVRLVADEPSVERAQPPAATGMRRERPG
jgi:hypothetical protein